MVARIGEHQVCTVTQASLLGLINMELDFCVVELYSRFASTPMSTSQQAGHARFQIHIWPTIFSNYKFRYC